MKHVLRIVLLSSAIAVAPAWADPDKDESGHYTDGGPSRAGDSYEAERDARKHYEEREREVRKYHEELWRERRKHRDEMERESLKHHREMEREWLEQARELERVGGGRYLYRIWFSL